MTENQDPLYAAYRRAVLNRDDEEALKILESIVRANPSDSNAAAELLRLDAKVLAARLQHLGESATGSDARVVVAEIEAIEAFGFKARPEGEAWRKAQVIRCGVLLEESAELKQSARWQMALAKIDFIRSLQKNLKLDLPPEAAVKLAELEAWARAEKEKDAQERQFQSLLVELQVLIQKSEEKDTSARYVELPELRDDYEALHKVWRSLADFARPIPPESMVSFKKRSALLEGEIYRRTAIRRRLIAAAGVFILLVLAAAAWTGARVMKAHLFSRELRAAIAQRQVHAAQQLLEEARSQDVGDADLLASARTFVDKEDLLLTNFDAAFTQLPQRFPHPPDAARLNTIADQLSLVRDDLNALAPDLKTENAPRLQAYEQNWQNYLAESGGTVNALLEKWVAAAEYQAAGLNYEAPLSKARSRLAALSELIQKANDCAAGYGRNIQLRTDLLDRLAAVRHKAAVYQSELDKVDNGLAEVERAENLDEFAEGIKALGSSEYSGAPSVGAASAIETLDINMESVVRHLLGATNAGTWAYIRREQPANFIPEAVMPAERQILLGLEKDPAIGAHHEHYRFQMDRQGNDFVEWITAGLLDPATGWKTISAWTVSPNATSAVFSDHDYGCFDGQYKLSPTEPVFQVDELGATDPTASFYSIGLEAILSGDNSYSKSMLEVLDSLKNSREGSPLFRAYLFERLVDLMNLQADDWGVSFCPALRADAARIRTITGGGLADGDWFVPSKISAYQQPLEQFFSAVRNISYDRQAIGILLLDRAVSKDGVQYAGYMGLDQRPHFVAAATPRESWGYSAVSPLPLLLTPADDSSIAPLSPLFTTRLSRTEYLENAGVNPGAPSFKGVLPPMFQNPNP